MADTAPPAAPLYSDAVAYGGEAMSNRFNQRSDGREFPAAWPPGWHFLKYALASFGSAYLREKGGWPFNVPDLYFDPPQSTQPEVVAYAHKQAPRVMDAFTGLLCRGELKSGYTMLGGGKVQPMPEDWWFTTRPYLRFRTWSIDPADPFSEAENLPCWIWVDADQLAALLEKMSREFNGWGPVPTYDDWLAAQPVYREPTGAGRPEQTTDILRRFRARVDAGTVCERVSWEGRAIHREYDEGCGPMAKTCADRIRPFFNLIERSAPGEITNQPVVLAALDDAINGF